MNSVLLEARPFRPFKSSEEYLYAMKEDLAEWLQMLYPHLNIDVDNFFEKLETGVALCEHANAVKAQAYEYVEKKQARKIMARSITGSLYQAQQLIRIADVKYFNTAKPGTFFSRDNVSNFINWCKKSLEILECLLFESDDLIMRKNEKHVILCLLEVARRGAKFGMLAPMLVQMERQIDREIAQDQKKMSGIEEENSLEEDSDSEFEEEPVLMYGPVPQIVTNDLKSLDEMVRDLVAQCTCPTQFPMVRVSEGKYRIGDTKVLIFVRILRNHVMVRVGGGWDTLSHYLDKHDPCRCKSQHRSTQSARLVNKPGANDLHGSHVYYERSPQPSSLPHIPTNSQYSHTLGPPTNSLNRSRSRSPSHLGYDQSPRRSGIQTDQSRRSLSPRTPRRSLAPPAVNRSRSPTPHFTSTAVAKLSTSPKLGKNSDKDKKAKHVTNLQIPVENSNTKVMKSEAVLHVNDTDHSDTTSEMSDEGYRSLGVVGQDKTKQRSSIYSQNSAEDVEESEHQAAPTEDDLNDFGLRKTHFSQVIYENDTSAQQKNKVQLSVKENGQENRQKPPLSRGNSSESAENSKNSPKRTPIVSKKTMETTNGTWNGRSKASRPQISSETFSPTFKRNSIGRRSMSAVSYDRRSSSVNTSPTKTKLREELLNTVKKDADDETIVQKVQELLKKYGSLNTLNNDDTIDGSPVKFDRRSTDRMSYRSPRKDSRPDTNLSKIPAPISYKT